jgi:hypothetical protein
VARREGISKKLRFEIFARDNFCCSYCRARGVPLRVDHVFPVAFGGGNEKYNLTTACFECNAGKSDAVLLQLGIRYHALKYVDEICEVLSLSRPDAVSNARCWMESFFDLREWVRNDCTLFISGALRSLRNLTDSNQEASPYSEWLGDSICYVLDMAVADSSESSWFTPQAEKFTGEELIAKNQNN